MCHLLHLADDLPVEHAPSLVREEDVDGDHIAAGHELLKVLHQLDAHLRHGRLLVAGVVQQLHVPRLHVHNKGYNIGLQ